MNEATLNYVRQHADDDVRLLALRGSKDPEVDMTMALQQIQGLQTARRKLPAWAVIEGIVYPPHLNMEQCSSEQTSRYKAALCQRLLKRDNTAGEQHAEQRLAASALLDLTGGFGVDFAFMSEAFDKATYVERDAQLYGIALHNFDVLGKQVKTVNADGIEVLRQTEHATVIFLDPARRDDHGGRTYGIADCTPNVLDVKDELLRKSDFTILKLSPMLDWRKAVQDLGETFVQEVHIVSTGNECKELLVVLSSRGTGFTLHCTNLLPDGSSQLFTLRPQPSALNPPPSTFHPSPSTLHQYIYEPNASVMKAGCFAELERAFPVQQLSQNSHLFVSEETIDGFPGRAFHITAVTTMNKRDLKTALADIRQANITVRNFPLSVAELRKRLKLNEGGSTYIFATTLANGDRVLMLCQRL